ncbi:MAG: FkbM family methyltransferase [Desulfobacterales bacterium]|nr:FkbM family methyltransferase [Desulfobacterales bacterium]MCG2830378.1 FkbM family methyltransferase [Desulfobacteraceae bacterium]
MYVSTSLALLKEADTRLVCVDVGSAGGFHPRIEAIRSRADIIGFDANPEECARLNAAARAGERHINAVVGRENEKVCLELHKKRKTSSCYVTDMNRVRHFHDAERFTKEGTISSTTLSLDSICRSEGLDHIDYLKVDVEGLELSVLQGYTGPLLLAEAEVNFHPFRKDIPLFDEIMAEMRKRNFFLVDLRRTYWSPIKMREIRNYANKGFIMFGDALFALDPFVEANYAFLETAAARASYLALLCLYGYTAEALMVVDVLTDAGLMPADEAEKSSGIIRKKGTSRKLKARLGRPLLFAEKYVQLPISISSGLFMTDYCQADGDLGNEY